MKRLSLSMVCLVAAGLVSPVQADDGWSLSKLNPFAKPVSTSTRARASFSDGGPVSGASSGGMPRWGSQPRTATKKTKPSTLDQMSQGTKDFVAKTKSVLMPWSSSSKKSSPSLANNRQKKSTFTSWFSKKPEKKKQPETVKDFLGRPRPGF